MVTFDDAKDVAAKEFDPLFVMLFGLVVRNRNGNDLDFLVVMEDESLETDSKLQRSLGEFCRRFNTDPFVLPVS
ncbi:MAG: hypothetical protein PHC49_01185 [Desulfuromonadaceae bacterium]|nr:hypothetical protein [Desulfuromonadaceae bacterium]